MGHKGVRCMDGRGLIYLLKEHKQFASPAERNVIDYVQSSPREASMQSIQSLAEATYTSPSTVVRLCRKLGCDGYKEFRRELIYELALAPEGQDISLEGIVEGDGPEQIVRKVAGSCKKSIELTERLVSNETLVTCAEAILSARVVNFFGIGSSLLVAHDFEMKLMRINKECHVYDDWHNQLLCAKNMGEDALGIAISYSGLTSETIECARVAHDRGAKVIAITRFCADSPLVKYADAVVYTAANEPLVRSGAMASRMSQLMVVDMLYAMCVMRNREHNVSLLRQNYMEKRPPKGRAGEE